MHTACETVWRCSVCALCWTVSALTSSFPTNVSSCVHALYGMAAALSCVIGYWADCFACRPFFRPFVVSFSETPPPPSHSALSSCSRARGHIKDTEERRLLTHISAPAWVWPFSGRTLCHLPHTTYRRVLRKSICSHSKHQQCLYTQR